MKRGCVWCCCWQNANLFCSLQIESDKEFNETRRCWCRASAAAANQPAVGRRMFFLWWILPTLLCWMFQNNHVGILIARIWILGISLVLYGWPFVAPRSQISFLFRQISRVEQRMKSILFSSVHILEGQNWTKDQLNHACGFRLQRWNYTD